MEIQSQVQYSSDSSDSWATFQPLCGPRTATARPGFRGAREAVGVQGAAVTSVFGVQGAEVTSHLGCREPR